MSVIREAWESFERLSGRKRREKAKRKIHKFVRRERKKKGKDIYGRTY